MAAAAAEEELPLRSESAPPEAVEQLLTDNEFTVKPPAQFRTDSCPPYLLVSEKSTELFLEAQTLRSGSLAIRPMLTPAVADAASPGSPFTHTPKPWEDDAGNLALSPDTPLSEDERRFSRPGTRQSHSRAGTPHDPNLTLYPAYDLLYKVRTCV